MKLNGRRGRVSEETRPVAGGKTGKGTRPTESVQRKPGAVKQTPGQRRSSPREIFLDYRRALTKGFRLGAKAERNDSSELEERERWAALLTLCRMFRWQPRDLGILYFGNWILGPTVKTEKILTRFVLWLVKNQLDELAKAA